MPDTPAPRPTLRSLVVLSPLSMLARSMFLFGLFLLPLAALKAAEGSWQRAGTAGVLGLGLLQLNAAGAPAAKKPARSGASLFT